MNRIRGVFVLALFGSIAAAALASRMPMVALPFIVVAGLGLGVAIWPGDLR